ncbi:MAG: ABC-F family ATP-binding cassette domain-containing protein [Oscillospiraceae bacterium]|nr:ABC-F family ATP-binding cassette domain-containing protein [Oscillospiraceae bacterium]
MIDISIQNVVKAFEEGNDILKGVTFDIYEGEHIGLLGKNGAGKTTLFRIITGALAPDEGEVILPAGKKIGLISQIPVFPEQYTTEDVLRTAFSQLYALEEKLGRLARQMEQDPSDALLSEYDALAERFRTLGGYDTDYEINAVANGLEIPEAQRRQLFSTLSGGEKTRVNLARLILEKTDILLLDEPTNHLDMKATQWLEEYVGKFKGTVLIISHDRYFLDRTVTRTVEILNGEAAFYAGNYSYYVVEKQRRYEEQLKKYEREQAEIRRLQQAADRLHQWGTGNKNLMKKSFAIQSRIDRMERTERPDREKTVKARFGEKEFRGDEAMVLRGVEMGFGEKHLFSIPELHIEGGERIALIGENGTGKSTLIKILMGSLRQERGSVKTGPQVKIAYLPQIVTFSRPERNMVDTLIYEDNCSPQSARNRLGAFKFSGEDVFKPVSALSGGERSRLKLCMLMKEDVNFLILDEPTNHLDIDSREWIEEAVEDFGGTLLFVSHDRYFINRFATRIWELKDGTITDFKGSYEKYCSYQQMTAKQPAPPAEKKAPRREAEPRRRSGGNEKKAAKLEREIARLEQALAEIDRQREQYASDYEKLMELDSQAQVYNEQIEELMRQWEQYSQ